MRSPWPRKLAPKNIHVAHFIIDGKTAANGAKQAVSSDPPDQLLCPDAMPETYLSVHRQHRSAWSWEVESRPWVETF
ncbi:hypothetical protein LB462_15195 [Phyllobacterium sp. KW56]|nr:hypothetical protein [Phyllobacterium sp. KW56]MBZ9603190.1 hypothetical protein [Phyllobacterium sp. KW56]